jgi:hypothetical protein
MERKNQQKQIGANNDNVGLTFISMSDSAVVARGRMGGAAEFAVRT